MKKSVLLIVIGAVVQIQSLSAWWFWSTNTPVENQIIPVVPQEIIKKAQKEIKADAYKKYGEMKEEKRKDLHMFNQLAHKFTNVVFGLSVLKDAFSTTTSEINHEKNLKSLHEFNKDLDEMTKEMEDYHILRSIALNFFPETFSFNEISEHDKYILIALIDDMINFLEKYEPTVQLEATSKEIKLMYSRLIEQLSRLYDRLDDSKDYELDGSIPWYKKYENFVKKYRDIALVINDSIKIGEEETSEKALEVPNQFQETSTD